MNATRIASGVRVRVTPDERALRKMARMAGLGYAVPELTGATGTVREHTRLWSWDEGREDSPTLTFETVIVDLDDGNVTSCEPGWLERIGAES